MPGDGTAAAVAAGPERPAAAGVPERWASILGLIPGYDSVATAKPGMWFDAGAADTGVAFFRECLTHVEGALAGKPFALEPWQQAIVGCLFGWKRAEGTRRYREAGIMVPRKNGKTPFAAGIANYVLFCDPERGQQNLVAAGDRDQASLLFRQAAGMVQQEPELAQRAQIFGARGGSVQKAICLAGEPSSFRVVSADAEGKHGGNLHLAIIDELHVQPDRHLVDVIQTSMASANRRQPLFIWITTSDWSRPSICNEKHDYACKVRDRIIDDPAFLPVIYEAPPDADWKSPEVWAKANPNLGVSVSVEYMERECQHAQEIPAYENTFKRLHLNVQTEQDVRWLQLDRWDACKGERTAVELLADLRGQECHTGLDLSSIADTTSLAAWFPERKACLVWYWVPKENAEARERRDRVPYVTWARQGFIKLTDGNRVDYDVIRADLRVLAQTYKVRSVSIDPWNATQLFTQLQADAGGLGFEVIECRQGFKSLNSPSKELERLLLGGEIAHGGNPVLRWQAGNVTVETDKAGNIAPSKSKSTGRIDGIVALVMAIGRGMVQTDSSSVYEKRGLTVV